MKTKSYLIICLVVSVSVVAAVLYIPGVSDTIEQLVLLFLSTNAR